MHSSIDLISAFEPALDLNREADSDGKLEFNPEDIIKFLCFLQLAKKLKTSFRSRAVKTWVAYDLDSACFRINGKEEHINGLVTKNVCSVIKKIETVTITKKKTYKDKDIVPLPSS